MLRLPARSRACGLADAAIGGKGDSNLPRLQTSDGTQDVEQGHADRCVTLRDGRRIGVAEFGARTGAAVLYFHGLPASRLEARLAHRAAVGQHVRLVALDRPGYGRSDFRPGTLADWPADIAEVADALGLDRFAVLGVSGGGPYALACAACLPARVSATAIVAGLGETMVAEDFARLEVFARMSFRLARSAPVLSRTVNRVLAALLRRRPELLNTLLAAGMSAPDREVLADPEVQCMLEAALHEAFRSGSSGASQDLKVLAHPWNFDVRAIRVPCYLWHGEQDKTVPVEMGRRLASLIPGCSATFLPDEGHFSLPIRYSDAVLQTVVHHL